MKLSSFRLINCFGFRDSGEINLLDPHNFIYLLGRNSSGKSSLLNAIEYFEVTNKPADKPNFQNFKDTGDTPYLCARFVRERTVLDYQSFEKRVLEMLRKLMIDETAVKQNPKLQRVMEELTETFKSLYAKFNKSTEIFVRKTGDGHYQFDAEDDGSFESRRSRLEQSIIESREADGSIVVLGANRNVDLSFYKLEDLIFYDFPSIQIFNKTHPLNESLPDKIEVTWEDTGNSFLSSFIKYLGVDDIKRLFVANDPEERDKLLAKIRARSTKLETRINRSTGTDSSELLTLRLDFGVDGLQITVATDGKKSFYSHLSENTKFLFAYNLYTADSDTSEDVLLFDEPNNGFHPSAQKQMLRFLQDLARTPNQVIVSTHSEYLIDPDYFSSIRLMGSDSEKYITVRNHFYNQAHEKGDFLALQPIFDAIGYKYGNQLEVEQQVVIVEGITDLLYLRAFNTILHTNVRLNIAPARGDGTITHIVSFLISQGLAFKIVLDTGQVKKGLLDGFGIDSAFIYEIPIPADYLRKHNGSGIEDLFSKHDFENLLTSSGHTVGANFQHVSNSQYMKSLTDKSAKRLIAHHLYQNATLTKKSAFEKETLSNFQKVLRFCGSETWFSI